MATKTAPKKKLVIVESPSKAKTIGKFLGSTYVVKASTGHVRDLPKSRMGIKIEEDFDPEYINIRGRGDIIKELKKEAKNAKTVFLATDPDREGEAISWHLAYILGIDPETECRVVFNEITKDAVKKAISNPRKIDLRLVDAQQARRVLDRLVGYSISPILWEKVQRGLSAGRVQSAALKIICDREDEINKFVPEEYWTIIAEFDKKLSAELKQKNGKAFKICNKEENDAVLSELKAGQFVVSKIEKKTNRKNPQPPFTTSSMQQVAGSNLNFTSAKTMKIAQELYEGVNIKGRGSVGLVTYIRTDSTRISDEARAKAKEFIVTTMGEKYYGGRVYSNGKKAVQDAHEAIRPSDIYLTPDVVKEQVTSDQYKLYKLVWERFMASQMASAEYDAVNAAINNGPYTFTASGSKMIFDGFRKVYSISKDKDTLLPALEEGEVLNPTSVDGEQKFTQPPKRFTESTLVKELEELGIGRPSTYAPIVSTLQSRKYIKKSQKALVPTPLGVTVTGLMEDYFKEIVDVGFTADMEYKLDQVEGEGVEWKGIIRDFYGPFEAELKKAESEVEKQIVEAKEKAEPVYTGEICEVCGKRMVEREGRFGKFIACEGYPECKNTKQIIESTGVKCHKCGNDIIVKRSKRGKIFYGCSNYPECKEAYWNLPVKEICPKCGRHLVEKKNGKGKPVCETKGCDYKL